MNIATIGQLRRAEGHGYPRPQLERRQWTSLNGWWSFARDPEARWEVPCDVTWEDEIRVPFAPETSASGVDEPAFLARCWYRRSIEAPPLVPGERLILHFGAVDYEATVWLDGRLAARHEGGYTPFDVDLTPMLEGPGTYELCVRADDDPLDLAKPRGKQDWELEPHSIWYPRTTGIWQTVWLERVPRVAIEGLQWSSDLDRYEVAMELRLRGRLEPGLALRVRLAVGERELVDDVMRVTGKRLERAFLLDGTGLDTLRDALAWTPDHPVLIDALLEVLDDDGAVVDEVHSYTALRSVGVRAGRFLLNGRPFPLRLVLDQGYWPESGLTPPGDDALRRDVELAKAMGFNGVRKHQKIADPRYLYWADRLGLVVWAEMPPAYRFDNEAVRRTTREWSEAIERDRSHPCIVAWVPFNESTGTLSLPSQARQRHYVESMVLLTRALDGSRPVVANDGWEALGGDIIGIHDYDQDVVSLLERYSAADLDDRLRGFAAHGRVYVLDDPARVVGDLVGSGTRPLVLSEFGGIGWAESAPVRESSGPAGAGSQVADRLRQPASWGYSTVEGPSELAERYTRLLAAVHSIGRLAGSCYTQFADTYQEVNGLLRSDRTPKFPLEVIRAATLGQPIERRGHAAEQEGVVIPRPCPERSLATHKGS